MKPAIPPWIRPAAAVLVLALLAGFLGRATLRPMVDAALDTLGRLDGWGPAIFVGLYVLACVFLVPGSALTLGAGALFGLVQGVFCVWIGATLGAVVAFLVGRHLARDAVARRLQRHPGFRRIDEAVAKEGWRIVLLTRLSPVFPFNVLNYAFGITAVSLRDYTLATALGILPGTTLYVYLGSLAGDLAGRSPQRTPLEWTFYAAGLAATVLVTIRVTRLARQALRPHLPPTSP
jgi:uncharacterized membrane protein YdjX (TVP38/TMEM64 family)